MVKASQNDLWGNTQNHCPFLVQDCGPWIGSFWKKDLQKVCSQCSEEQQTWYLTLIWLLRESVLRNYYAGG